MRILTGTYTLKTMIEMMRIEMLASILPKQTLVGTEETPIS